MLSDKVHSLAHQVTRAAEACHQHPCGKRYMADAGRGLDAAADMLYRISARIRGEIESTNMGPG